MGSELVEWLLSHGKSTAACAAIGLGAGASLGAGAGTGVTLEAIEACITQGQALINAGVMHHVCDEHPFRATHLFYRFYCDESEGRDGERSSESGSGADRYTRANGLSYSPSLSSPSSSSSSPPSLARAEAEWAAQARLNGCALGAAGYTSTNGSCDVNSNTNCSTPRHLTELDWARLLGDGYKPPSDACLRVQRPPIYSLSNQDIA